MFDALPISPFSPVPSTQPGLPDLLAMCARVERLEAQLQTVVATRQQPAPPPAADPVDEWIWEGNRARRLAGGAVSW